MHAFEGERIPDLDPCGSLSFGPRRWIVLQEHATDNREDYDEKKASSMHTLLITKHSSHICQSRELKYDSLVFEGWAV